MIELIEDIHEVFLENVLQDAITKHTHFFKKRLVKEFGKSIGFCIVGKKQIVYCSEVNPCKYVVATFEGAGLRGDDICLSFARIIRRHIEKSTVRELLSFSELISYLGSHQPLQPLFNTIAWTLKPKAIMTSFGMLKLKVSF